MSESLVTRHVKLLCKPMSENFGAKLKGNTTLDLSSSHNNILERNTKCSCSALYNTFSLAW